MTKKNTIIKSTSSYVKERFGNVTWSPVVNYNN